MTNDSNNTADDTSQLYGTTVEYDGEMYVKIDGSDLLTPVETTTEIRENDRVHVDIRNHQAFVTGNVTNPAVGKVTAGELESNITQTADQIRLEVKNTAEGLEASITITAEQIRSEVKNTKEGLESQITQTASEIRSEVKNTKEGLESQITQTASEIRSEVRNTTNGLQSQITQTANELNILFSEGYEGKVTITSGSVNINNNFIVSTSGSLTTNSTIVAQGGIYTSQDIRGLDPTGVSGGLTLVTGTGHLAVRTENSSHSVYLQSASGEVKCTLPQDPNNYIDLRAYNLLANNAVYANGVQVTSDINRKRDIELYEVDALAEICSTPVYTYHLDTDLDEELKRIGIIMQEAPLDAIDLTGKGVDLYQMTTMLWKAVQQLNAKIE